jgi:radical SAM superfamily enzyme YgiQ (UPF0313 family)
MARVLLIQANYDITGKIKEHPWMPVALVELGTFIKEKGHKVQILDRNLYPDNVKLKKIIDSFNPDIVGMTCYTSPVIRDVRLISRFVKENSHAMVIIGGIHATLEPKSLLDFKFIDYVVRGEGEETLLEICELIDAKKATKNNILKLKNINYNPLRPPLNLFTLPIPDYELLEVKKYPFASFYTSRGCPGNCKFCYNQGKRLRFYDTDKTIESITRVLDKYKIREFNILDDNFANMSARSTKICEALSKRNAIFHCFLRADQTSDKVMSELKKAGCWIIQFGFESGSQRMLDFMNKETTVGQNEVAIKQCKKYGMFVDGSFMIGLPSETKEDLKMTLDFIRRTKPDISNVKIYKPYPSTEFFNYCTNKNLIVTPKNLDEWIDFCELKEGNVNVSEIPKEILLKAMKDYDKPSSAKTSLRKILFMIRNGHLGFLAFKLKEILKNHLM